MSDEDAADGKEVADAGARAGDSNPESEANDTEEESPIHYESPISVTYVTETHDVRRMRFEKLEDGYIRIEEEWTGCKWHVTGEEHVSSVAVNDRREPLEPQGTRVFRGP
ncbi:hypothetical protein [Halosegnis longus]|uniref:hypothetical protein n=1 Tax=Halosegnis longus TaxID=2216012 RepID=UPI00129DBAE5|nr:hypothetical protein [Halosegnis longus]